MAILSTILKHLQDAGLAPAPKVPYTAWNGHKFDDGLGIDGWPLIYWDADAKNWVFSNDGGKLINAPLRVSLIGTSASIVANVTLSGAFNRLLPVTAGALDGVGLEIRVTAGGEMGTAASTPGTVLCAPFIQVDPAGAVVTLASLNGTLVAGIAANARRWYVTASATVRTAGAASVIQPGGGHFTGPFTAPADPLVPSTVETPDLTVAINVGIFWSWSFSSGSNTARMDTFFYEIMRPGATVS